MCLYCQGIESESFTAFLNGVILLIIKNKAVIIAAIIAAHHEIALRFRLKLHHLVILCRGDCFSDCCHVFLDNITPFKKAAKDSLPMPQQYKQIHFVFGKISLFSVSIYKYIFILSRNTSKIRNLTIHNLKTFH